MIIRKTELVNLYYDERLSGSIDIKNLEVLNE